MILNILNTISVSTLEWVLAEMSLRPAHVARLRQEIADITGSVAHECPANITYDMVKQANLLDSFIREVMRTKGDTLSLVRKTTADVPLGGYVIPKGMCRLAFDHTSLQNSSGLSVDHLVLPLATLCHMNSQWQGFDAEKMDPERWADSNERAVKTGHRYLAFGLGHYACPGRFLAVCGEHQILKSSIYH